MCNLLVLSREVLKLLNGGSVLDEAVKISLEEIEGARAKHNQELLHRIDIESGHTQPPLSSNTEVKSVKSHGDAESSINRSGELSSEESPSIGSGQSQVPPSSGTKAELKRWPAPVSVGSALDSSHEEKS